MVGVFGQGPIGEQLSVRQRRYLAPGLRKTTRQAILLQSRPKGQL